MKLSQVAFLSAIAGPMFMLSATIGSFFQLISIFISVFTGVSAFIIGIIALIKEGNSNQVLFALIIGSIWVLFIIFTIIFILPIGR